MAVCYSRMSQIQTLVLILAGVSSFMAPGPCKKIEPTSPICVNAPADCGALPVPDCAGVWTCGELMECVFVCEDVCIKDADCPADTSCQQGQCLEMQSCYYAPPLQGNCLPEGVLCAVYGSAGSTVDCPLHLASVSPDAPPITAVQLVVTYGSELAEFGGFFDNFCTDGFPLTCMDVKVPPNNLWPSGHEVKFLPKEPPEWKGEGQVVIHNLVNPMAPVTPALVVAGQLVGDSEIMRARFVLKSDIDPSSPLFLMATDIFAGSADAGTIFYCNVEFGVTLCEVAPD